MQKKTMDGILRFRNKLIESIFGSDVTVNCWFCNENNKIKKTYHQSWICSHCEQYNGFTEDGGYNQELSEQFNVKDYRTKTLCTSTSVDSGRAEALLCKSCSQNQVMKVRQLADFSPFHENDYDQEVDIYKDYLEHLYSLCPTCEAKVRDFLYQQDSSLLSQMDDSLHHRLAHLSRKDRSYYDESEQRSSLKSHNILISRIMLAQSSLCSMFLSIVNLRLLAGSMSVYSGTAFSSYLTKVSGLLITMIPGALALDMRSSIAFVGVFSCLFGLFWVGKYSYYPEDVVHILLWLLTVIVLSLVDVPLLWNLCLNVSTMCVSVLCCVKNRRPRNVTSTSIQRKDLMRTSNPNVSHTNDSADAVPTSGESLKSNSLDQSEHKKIVEPLPQYEIVRQNLESVSLGLGKKSASSSSIWSLPSIVSSSSSPSSPSINADVVPDSSTDFYVQKKRVLSPSRLGFLSYDPQSPSKDKPSELSQSPSPWFPISTYSTCANSPDVISPQPISRSSSWRQGNPKGSKSDSRLGPCDSQGDVPSASSPRNQCVVKTGAESSFVNHQKGIDSNFIAPKPAASRRSSRIAMAGRPKKPWPLQKSYSCTSAFDFYKGERALHISPPIVNNIRNKDVAHHQPGCGTSVSDKVAMSDKQRRPKTSSKSVGSKQQDFKVNSKMSLPEVSDDENWELDKTEQRCTFQPANDFSWKWIFLGLVLGVSITVNVFLLINK